MVEAFSTVRRLASQGDVTVVLTSCGRHDLLERTVGSFRAFNTDQGIREIILIEDGDGDPGGIAERYSTTLVRLGRRVGQIGAIDVGYSMVTTPYIFHLEDDWEFFRSGFIERSRRILEADLSTLCVWIRAWNDTNGHPLSFRSSCRTFGVIAETYQDWHGFMFNPGLRRLCDYLLARPYSQYALSSEGHPHYFPEMMLSQLYHKLGFRAVILDEAGYVRHIGWDRHVD